MIERDWTLTDEADAADDRRHREWWRAAAVDEPEDEPEDEEPDQ